MQFRHKRFLYYCTRPSVYCPSFQIYLQLYTWNSEAGVGLMDCNVPPSLHTFPAPPLHPAASSHASPCTLCWMWSAGSFVSVGSALYQWGNKPAAMCFTLAYREGPISVHLSATVKQADLCQNKPLCIRRTAGICKCARCFRVLICS